MSEDRDWKRQTLLVGALIGAITGAGVAYMLVRRAEEQGEPFRMGAGEGVRLGMGVLGLLRLVSGFSDDG
jgi:hypothetical protein